LVYITLIYTTLNIKDRKSSGMKLGDRGGHCIHIPLPQKPPVWIK